MGKMKESILTDNIDKSLEEYKGKWKNLYFLKYNQTQLSLKTYANIPDAEKGAQNTKNTEPWKSYYISHMQIPVGD